MPFCFPTGFGFFVDKNGDMSKKPQVRLSLSWFSKSSLILFHNCSMLSFALNQISEIVQ